MKKAVKIIVNILAWVFLLLALLVTVIVFSAERNNGVSNIMGFMPMTVESNSMSPTFKKGDLIIVKEIDDVNDLKEGDVITYWTHIGGKRVRNTHRIVKVNLNDQGQLESFTTRGDNNNGIDDDTPASPNDIIGKWSGKRLAGCGKALDFLRTKKGFFMCIIIPMAIFFLFELYKFIVTLVEIKKGDAPEQLDEDEIKRRAIEEYLAEQKKKEAEAAAEAKETVTEKAAEAKETVTEKAAEAKETVTEKAEEAAEEVSASAEERTDAAVAEAEERAKAAADMAREAVEEKAETAGDELKEAVTEIAAEQNNEEK